MKRISWYEIVSMGSLAVSLALSTLVWSADSPGSTPAASDASPSQSSPAQGAATPAQTQGMVDRTAPAAQSSQSVQTAPSSPDYGSEAAREESTASVASTYAPNMIGDMGGGPIVRVRLFPSEGQGKPINLNVPLPSAGILGCQRFADNDCTLPTDRVFCDYSYFHNAQLASPMDANRFVPGFEKTFLDKSMSVEMRFPMGALESNDIVDGSPFGTAGQFGDIQVIVKALLLQEHTLTLGMGMAVSIPTAPDLNISNVSGAPLAKITNYSTHLLPYVGLLVNPNDDWFAQVFVQADIAANGNAVSADVFGNGLTSYGQIYDQTLIFVDATIGRWLYRNPGQRFSGLAAVVEAHYTGGLNAPSTVQANGFSIGYDTASYQVLDLTVGAHAILGKTIITAGFATPVTEDRVFDGELRLFVNRQF
jgi:hypothetical protein